MKYRTIGKDSVGEIGLGCMGMSWAYGIGNDAESLGVLARSLELGVNHWDTADMYGAGDNERLIAKALPGKRDRVFLATKFGNVHDRSMTTHQDLVDANAEWIVDGTPEYARKCIDASLARLGVDSIDLYYLHRVDPQVPIEETVGAMAEFVEAGKVKYIGLSEASTETIRRAHKVHPITAVQSEFSLWTQDYLASVIPVCVELGAAFVPFSPLGRGFLTGTIKSQDDLPENDWRRSNPRFEADNLQQNLTIVAELEKVALSHDVPASQVALAWVLAQSPNICPIPGTKRLKYLDSNAAASDLTLTERELKELSGVAPTAGARYQERMLSTINL